MHRFVIDAIPSPTEHGDCLMVPQPMPSPSPMPLTRRARRQAALLRLYSAADAVMIWSLRVGERLQLWQERYRQRRALGTLSEHMLKDLGMSRADTGRETGKRFWEA